MSTFTLDSFTFHICERTDARKVKRNTTETAEEMDQMFCAERLNRLELEEECLRTEKRKIYKILKRADKVGKELFSPKC